jgi:hypothetical protein
MTKIESKIYAILESYGIFEKIVIDKEMAQDLLNILEQNPDSVWLDHEGGLNIEVE